MSKRNNCNDCEFFASGYEHSKICLATNRVVFPDEDTSDCEMKSKVRKWNYDKSNNKTNS
jgi:hypothetical protein